MTGAQAPLARVPLADGTLVATAEVPDDDLIPSLLATSDVFGTGWYAADAARVQPGSTVVVVGDGAVGLMGVLAAQQMEAGRIIIMSRHKTRQDLALKYGATDIVAERGDDGVAKIKKLTANVGADSVLECVGTNESMAQALECARPGSMIGYVAAWRHVRWAAAIHLAEGPDGRTGSRAPLPAAPDGPGARSQNQSRQGVRS
jgi:threonine dehydrogenase-like Zn-dependent dehydrogenase